MLVVGNAAYKINLETDSIHCIRLDFVLVLFAPGVIYSIMQIDADDVPRSRTLPWKSVRRELPLCAQIAGYLIFVSSLLCR
jgi:hypothetical protein